MDYDKKLEELFIDLPAPAEDMGNAVGAVQSGKLLFVSATYSFAEGRLQFPGRVGIEVRVDNARMAARSAAVQSLAVVKRELGGTLNKIKRVVQIDGSVACGADFSEHIRVVDGAGELFVNVFGASGKCARTATGAPSLPHNACISIAVIYEVK